MVKNGAVFLSFSFLPGKMWFLEGRVKTNYILRVESGVCTYAAATKAGAGDLPRHGEDVKQIFVDSVH